MSSLTPDDKGRLAKNFKGYDISPDMVRLSLVNLYLHGFTDPHIFEYDTLTSEERWNEFADVKRCAPKRPPRPSPSPPASSCRKKRSLRMATTTSAASGIKLASPAKLVCRWSRLVMWPNSSGE